MKMTKAIILAAGYATRLYPLTENQPKPLLKIADKPLIEYIIEKIYEIEAIDEIIIVSNDKFYNHFLEWNSSFNSKIPIKILDDGSTTNENRLGAIKDIQFALKQENISEDTLIIAGDNLFEFNLKDLYNLYKEKNASITAAFDVKDKNIVKNRHGVVILDNSNKVIDFQEKPEEPKSTIKSIACYILTKEAIKLLEQYIKEGNNSDAPGFFLEWLCKKTKLYACLISKPVYGIGSMKSYLNTNKIFSDKLEDNKQ